MKNKQNIIIEFFKVKKEKIILTILLVIFVYVKIVSILSSDFLLQKRSYFDKIIEFPSFAIVNSSNPNIASLVIPAEILYMYLVSCILVFAYKRLVKFFKK